MYQPAEKIDQNNNPTGISEFTSSSSSAASAKPVSSSSQKLKTSIPWAKPNQVQFIAEQVSHHPPISAFYAENLSKRIQFTGQIWTKSKFLGLSICVHNIGQGCISLLDGPGKGEEYIVNFPTGYGRSIVSTPWIELGGQCNITCEQTGYKCDVDFQTKPFYGGKLHKIVGSLFGPASGHSGSSYSKKKPILTIEGEWNGLIEITGKNFPSHEPNTEFENLNVGQNFVDTKHMPIHRPYVRNLNLMENNESRKLWKNVTHALRHNLVDMATDEKLKLEAQQRADKAERERMNQKWENILFTKRDDDIFVFKNSLQNRLDRDT